ncbi:MAG: hypothetical protein GY716_00095 [bacterium]|nr:hypothetical protein [bacterium]
MEAETAEATARKLVAEYGEEQSDRIAFGVDQVARRWWEDDGDAAAFDAFCLENFVAEPQKLAETFDRIQYVMEQIDGHLHEIQRELASPMHLDTGEVAAIDTLFGDVDLSAHVDEDLFRSKVAFVALLNFPVHTLTERLQHGESWDRETWAASRMMDRFAQRVPARVAQQISKTFTAADHYIAGYNIRMDRLVTRDGRRPFPEGLRLITHWGLRDELKSQYAEDNGLERQRMILEVMNRIVRQEIPALAIDNADVLWAPETNEIWGYDAESGKKTSEMDAVRENDVRYSKLLEVYHAVRQADPYSPIAPTYIDRRFNLGRQIPEKQVEELLVSVLSSREFKETAKLIKKRLGRRLEPFDIWYDGFKARGEIGQAELDRLVGERYPDVAAFQGGLPEILTGLGFAADKAAWLSDHIVVDPSRGAGHAMGAVRREDQAHLRTRFGPDGMDYKGYNIAVHELGHNVEQVYSLNGIDHWWLNGVPNTAFTEALAFVFQNRDLELLGFPDDGAESRHLEALDTLWGTAEIGGVALVDMGVWRWMYDNPEATPAELRVATQRIARGVWNRYFAPAFGVRDQDILGIYSHMVVYGLYLPDYPLGHMIAFQVAEKLRGGDFGKEFERVSRQGRLTPDAWMRGAVGSPVSSKALLTATRKALEAID